jgi:ketol-acid reductoisomerase
MDQSEFVNGIKALKGKKCCVGCGAQGLNQGLNMRDSDWIFLTYAQMQLLKKELLYECF